jgi:hypothetical protein
MFGQDPEAGSIGFGMAEDGMLLAQKSEPLVRHALREDVPVKQIDVIESHVPSPALVQPLYVILVLPGEDTVRTAL